MKSFIFSVVALCVVVVNSFAGSPRDELLKRVPADVGFVVVVNDIRGNWDKLSTSPFTRRLFRISPGKDISDAPYLKKLEEFDRLLQKEVGTTAAKLRDEILGDAVVFIYRPGPPEKPDDDESLILLHARDPKLAADMFKHVDDAQRKSGQLKNVSDKPFLGRSYVQRQREGEPDEYQYQNGSLLAFGSSERLLQQIIEADTKPQTLSATIAERLSDSAVNDAAVAWWINPRAFDPAIAFHRKHAAGSQALVLAGFARHWAALDSIALSLHMERDAELRVTCTARPDALPAPVRLFLAEAAKPSDLLASIPSDALIRITGRLALPAVVDAGVDFLPEAARTELRTAAKKTLGAVLGQEVLSVLPDRLGPDWGLWVTAPQTEAKQVLPDVTAAVRLTESQAGPPVVPRVLDGLSALASFAAVAYNAKNSEPITLHTDQQGDVTVKYLAGESLPNGLKPAYAWKGGFLLVASNPEAVRRFNPPLTPANAPALREAPLVKIAMRGWAKYFRDHREAVAAFIATQDKVTAAEASQRIDAALNALDLFESVELTVRTMPGRADLGLRVKPAAGFVDGK